MQCYHHPLCSACLCYCRVSPEAVGTVLWVVWRQVLLFWWHESIYRFIVRVREDTGEWNNLLFYAPLHKMARGYFKSACFICHSVKWSLCPSVILKFVFSTPPIPLNQFERYLVQMLYHRSRCACGEITHVSQILPASWPLTLIIFTHVSLSSQPLLHSYTDFYETWCRSFTT